ncbi:retinol-binding protein 1.1 isoform X2 [Gadus morhua]|uniref:retinol-binding protein 1.1 isoform X2 n=1 Tax=Gadus morhua TaxID=8049 RepID=UPI0011B56277|nr:retinol-binding protein 1 isoform X2 [Gadus morhua]XP_056452586.1 retinol-binding protein 1.1 isoform X2 [Gadus chalcogrammus]
MPIDLNGYWKMISNDNFEEYLKALEVNVAIRKIATLLKPDKDITQDGDHITIKTLSTFKNYNMDFTVGQEFEEDLSGVDDRKCMACGAVFSDHCLLGWGPAGVCAEGRDRRQGLDPLGDR